MYEEEGKTNRSVRRKEKVISREKRENGTKRKRKEKNIKSR